MTTKIPWDGPLPNCDIHEFNLGESVPAKYDSPMRGGGSWANLCEYCMNTHGVSKDSDLPYERVPREATQAEQAPPAG